MKSVLHIALVAPGGYSTKPFMDAFLNNGFSEYRAFDYQLNRFNTDKATMQKMLIKEAQDMKPDIIFAQVQGSDVIDLETWQAISKIAFTVNFTFDIRTQSQTQWMYNLAGVIGLVCFSNQEDVDECKRYDYNNCMVMQSSCDMDFYKPIHPPIDVKHKGGVVFIGNNFENTNLIFPKSRERREMVEFLKKEFPDKFVVRGNGWPDGKLIGQNEEVNTYLCSLIAISHNNFDNELYTSDRLWRIMATGTMCLTKYFKGIEKWFIDGVHLHWWKTFDELRMKIIYCLDYPNDSYQVGIRGMIEVRNNHTWTARIKEMMIFIQTLNIPVKVQGDACLKAGAHVIDGVIPQAFDEHLAGKPCDCGRLRGLWSECNCGNKEFQFRWEENI